jgi:hypothetical protein
VTQPRIALWLIDTVLDDAALAGDLTEKGGSRLWYWRQVAMAIVAETAAHPVQTFGAVVMGWAVLVLFIEYVAYPLATLDGWLFETGLADLRWRWPNHRMLIFLFVCVGCVAAGWCAAKYYRRVLFGVLFAASVLAANLAMFPKVLGFYVSAPSLSNEYLSNPSLSIRAMLVEQTLIALVIMPACIAFGAILSGNLRRVWATRKRMT